MDSANAEARAKREIGQIVAERYRLEALLEFADTTATYQATDLGSGASEVTLYQLDLGRDEAMQRFERATQAVLALSDPHVLPALAAGRDPVLGPYLVTSSRAGRSLLEVLNESGGALSAIGAVRITLQAARGLSAAHALGIVHGNLKPSQLILAPEAGELIVKLKHFAVAAPFAYSREQSLTRTSSQGAPDYAAPEQLRRPQTATERSDVWSLAALLYEMLSGVAPFSHTESIAELIHAICNEDAPDLSRRAPWLDPELTAIVHLALDREPASRPTVAELTQRLARFSLGEPHLDELLLVPTSSASPTQRERAADAGTADVVTADELDELDEAPLLTPPTPRGALEVKVDISPSAAAGMANLQRGGRGGTSLPPERAAQRSAPRPRTAPNSWLFMILLIVVAGGLSMALGYVLHRH